MQHDRPLNPCREVESPARRDDVAALREMAREFEAGFNTGDVERIMRFYGDVYVDVNLRHPVPSRDERRSYYLEVMRRGAFRIAVQPDEIVVEHELAFVRGRIELTPLDPSGGASAKELRYLEISRKYADGTWKAVWGMDGPVQEYEPARRAQDIGCGLHQT